MDDGDLAWLSPMAAKAISGVNTLLHVPALAILESACLVSQLGYENVMPEAVHFDSVFSRGCLLVALFPATIMLLSSDFLDLLEFYCFTINICCFVTADQIAENVIQRYQDEHEVQVGTVAAACLAMWAMHVTHHICKGKTETSIRQWWQSPAIYMICVVTTLITPSSAALYLLPLHRILRWMSLILSIPVVIAAVVKFIGYIIYIFYTATYALEDNGLFSAVTMLTFKLAQPKTLLLYWTYIIFNSSWQEYHQEPSINQTSGVTWVGLTLATTSVRSPVSFVSTAVGVGCSHMMLVGLAGYLLSFCGSEHGHPADVMDEVDAGIDSASFFTIYCLVSGYEDKNPTERAADACLILYVVASLVLQAILRLTREALLDLCDLFAVTPFRPRAHFIALSVLSATFCFSAFLVRLMLADSGGIVLHGEDSLQIWSMMLATTNVMTCCRAAIWLCNYLYKIFKIIPTEADHSDIDFYSEVMCNVLSLALYGCIVSKGAYATCVEKTMDHTGLFGLVVFCFAQAEFRKIKQQIDERRKAKDILESMSKLRPEELISHNDVCPICHLSLTPSPNSGDEQDGSLTPCGHIFHSACILRWLYRSQKCPYCFTELRS